MKENSPVLKEVWHIGESIDDKGNYRKQKYRKVEQLGFYIRPLRDWFVPCPHCQAELKKLLAEGRWILGNKEYEPRVELNTTKNEVDNDSWITLEERKATKAEIDRIGYDGWEDDE
jgi:hypothetical protein